VGLAEFFKSRKQAASRYPKELRRYAQRDARVIPASEHRIEISAINRNALRVVRTLQQNGQAAYLVGGCVRDLLIGRRPKDFDVATDATPQRIKEIFRYARIIGRRFRIVHIPFGTEIIETATFRALPTGDTGDDMLLRDNVYGDEREDAFRRDITINALFYDPVKEVIIDYVDGYRDISNRVIRMVRDPSQSYTEDPVRMIRALKYKATTGFRIEKSGYEPIKKMAGLITACSSARVMEEIYKILRSGAACGTMQSLYAVGLLAHLAPTVTEALAAQKDTDFARSPLASRLAALDRLSASGRSYSNAVLLSVLLADIVSGTFEPGKRHILSEAAAVIEPISKSMNFSRQNKDQVLRIISSQYKFANPEKKTRTAMLALCRRDWFHDALDFLEISCHAYGLDADDVYAWRAFISNIPKAAALRGGVRIRRKGEQHAKGFRAEPPPRSNGGHAKSERTSGGRAPKRDAAPESFARSAHAHGAQPESFADAPEDPAQPENHEDAAPPSAAIPKRTRARRGRRRAHKNT